MTTPKIEEIPTMTPLQHLTEVYKRTFSAADAGQWARADITRDVVEAGLADSRPRAGAVVNPNNGASIPGADGSYRVIEQITSELHQAGFPEDLAIETIAKYRLVANAWPDEERCPQASYDAHRELASKTYNQNRFKIMDRLVSRSSRGIVTRADVRTYKSEMKPKKSTPFPTRVEQHLNKLFRGELRPAPDAPGEWGTIVDALSEALDEARRALADAKELTHA